MPDETRTKLLLPRVRRLSQTEETWESTGRLAHCWITPVRKSPYRPYMVLVASASGYVLRHSVLKTLPTADQMFEQLLRAMQRPAPKTGKARRPQNIYLDNADYVTELAPRLAELDIHCHYRPLLPNIDQALQALDREMNGGRELIPGLLSLPSVTPPLVKHLYELAADFYRMAPWRWLNDQHPMEIRFLPDGKPRYAVVMGSGGEIFGLAVYDSLKNLQSIYQRQPSGQGTMALFFEAATAMSFEDLDAAEKFGWPVVNENAYPILGRATKNLDMERPTAADIRWLEGALAAILMYLSQHKQVKHGVLQPADLTLTVPTLGVKSQVQLRLPISEAFDI